MSIIPIISTVGCSNLFHRFPDRIKDEERWRKWVNATKRKNFEPSKSTLLCSAHFKESDYYCTITGSYRLKSDAVPSIFDFPAHLLKNVKERRPLVRHISDSPEEVRTTRIMEHGINSIDTKSIIYLEFRKLRI